MFQQWIKNFKPGVNNDSQPVKYSVERLTALLLIEIARSDSTIDEVELSAVRNALEHACQSIDAVEIDNIISTAIEDADAAVSLHSQIRQINREFSREQKIMLIQQMWVVAFADGDLDKYEEHMIRKLSGLLYVNHAEYIQAKLKVANM